MREQATGKDGKRSFFLGIFVFEAEDVDFVFVSIFFARFPALVPSLLCSSPLSMLIV